MNLNNRCADLVRRALANSESLRIRATKYGSTNATLIDCGVSKPGGFGAGLLMARVSSANLAQIELRASGEFGGPMVEFATDRPTYACMASQYAGWEVKGEGYFGMASGPMRAVAAREPLFEELHYREKADACFGVIESNKLPPAKVCRDIADKCGIDASCLTMLVAPTRSIAGTLQIVARSVETAMHKLHELKFDLKRVQSAFGSAPLPPPAPDDLGAIGRTNDAILYGGRVTLYVRGDDDSLAEIGPRVPSSASPDYGRPFAETLKANNNDFYRIDPLLFSPAQITFVNLDTGRSFTFGETSAKVLADSFGA